MVDNIDVNISVNTRHISAYFEPCTSKFLSKLYVPCYNKMYICLFYQTKQSFEKIDLRTLTNIRKLCLFPIFFTCDIMSG